MKAALKDPTCLLTALNVAYGCGCLVPATGVLFWATVTGLIALFDRWPNRLHYPAVLGLCIVLVITLAPYYHAAARRLNPKKAKKRK